MNKFETDNSFSSGNRHTFVMKLSGALNAAGFEETEVKKRMPEPLRRTGFYGKRDCRYRFGYLYPLSFVPRK